MEALKKLLAALVVLSFLAGGTLPAAAEDKIIQTDVPQFKIIRKGEGWFKRRLRVNKVWPHQDMAYRLEKTGNWAGAARELELALEQDPLDDNIRFQLMVLLYRLGEDERCLTEADRLIAAHPEEPAVYLYKAEALRRLGRNREYRDILDLLARMPNLKEPARRQVQLTRIDLALKEGRYSDALDEINKVSDQENDSRIAMSRGLILSGLGRRRQALAAFLDAAADAVEERDRRAALFSAGEEAIKLKDYKLAQDLFERTRSALDDDPGLDIRLGNLAVLMDDYRSASDHYRKALDKGDPSALEPLFNALYKTGRYGEAESLAHEMVSRAESKEQKADALQKLASVYDKQGRYNAAAEAFSQAGTLNPSAEVFLAEARIKASLGKVDESEAAYKKALALSPSASSRFEFGMMLSRHGKNRQAIKELQSALNQGLSPKDRLTALNQIGFLALADSDYELAQKALRQSAGIAPEDRELKVALGDAAVGKGEFARAAEQYYTAAAQTGGMETELLKRAAVSWAEASMIAKSEQAYLDIIKNPGATNSQRLDAWLSIAYLRQKQGRTEAAASASLKAAGFAGRKQARTRILVDAANLYLAAGKNDVARRIYRQVLDESTVVGAERASVLLQLAQLEINSAPPDALNRARPLLVEAAAQPGLPDDLSARIQDELGFVEARLGNHRDSLIAFRQAMRRGGETPTRLLGAGYALQKMNRLAEALETFRRASQPGFEAPAAAAVAGVYGDIKKYGLAVATLQKVEPALDKLPDEERRVVYGQYGYYLEELQRPAEARVWYEKSLDLGPDKVTMFHLARVERRLGRPEKARELLTGISPEDLPDEYQSQYAVEQARLARALMDREQGYKAYREALKAHPDADLWAELGGLYRDDGDHEKAAEAYEQAAAMKRSPVFLMSLGYEEAALGREAEARNHLTEAVTLEPNYIGVNQDLGYLNRKLINNDEAVERFMAAIDDSPLRTVDDPEKAEAAAEDLHRMRGEVRTLKNQFNADLWLTFTSGEAGRQGQASGSGREIARTSSGLELSWLPPVIGFRDNRIFQVIARAAWNFKPDKVEVDKDSWSGAVGVRYKPFKDWNVNLGLEKLLGFTDETDDNWVARLMASLADGTDDPSPSKTIWNYSYLIGEADAYLEKPSRTIFTAEGRQGVSFQPWRNLVLTPFVFADVQYAARSSASDISFYEGGPGASIKYYFDENKYERPHRSAELLLTYRVGRIFEGDDVKEKNIDAFFTTILLHF